MVDPAGIVPFIPYILRSGHGDITYGGATPDHSHRVSHFHVTYQRATDRHIVGGRKYQRFTAYPRCRKQQPSHRKP